MSDLSPAQLQERRDAAKARWQKAREAGAALAGAAAGAGAAVAAQPVLQVASRRAGALLAARHVPDAQRVQEGAGRLLQDKLVRSIAQIDQARAAREKSIRRPFNQPLVSAPDSKPSYLGQFVRLLNRDGAADERLRAQILAAARGDHHDDDVLDQLAGQIGEIDQRQAQRAATREALLAARPATKAPRKGSMPTRQKDFGSGKAGDRHIRRATLARRPGDISDEQAKEYRGVLREHADEVAERLKNYAAATIGRQEKRTIGQMGARFERMAAHRIAGALERPGRLGLIGLGLAGGSAVAYAAAHALGDRSEKSAFPQSKSLAKQAGQQPRLDPHFQPARPHPKNAGKLSFFDRQTPFSAPPAARMSPPLPAPLLAKADAGNSDKNEPGNGRLPAGPDTLLNGAANVETNLARGVARALAAWKDAATPERIADPEAPGSLFDHLDEPLAQGMAPLDRATIDGLNAPTRIIPPNGPEADGGDRRDLQFGFNLRTPNTTDYAKRYRYSRVREITSGQRRHIRDIIADATLRGDPPAVTARRIRDVVGLTASQAQIVQNFRTALDTLDPRATNFALRDKRYDPKLKRALEDGTPLDDGDIDKMVDAYSRRFIAYRAMTIARTESMRAANNAHVDAVQAWLGNNPGFTVAKTWISTEDEKTRPDHVGLHRKTVIGMQTPFVCDSGEKIRWPHDPKASAKEVCNCRCTLMTVLVPRTAAIANGPEMYDPGDDFWSGPRMPFDITSPEDLFGEPA